MSTIYVPILKWKKGEQEALRHLPVEQKEIITPLIEIVDTVDPSLILEQLTKCFEYPVYVDTFFSEEYDVTFLKGIAEEFANSDKKIYPVLYFDNIEKGLKEFSSLVTRLALRIPVPEELDGPTYEDIFDRIQNCKKDYQDLVFDIILDLGIIEDGKNASYQLRETVDIIANHLMGKSYWNRVIISSTSFPEDLQSVPKSGSNKYKRYDILLFRKILENPSLGEIKQRILFSDYGVTKFSDSEIKDFSKFRYGILPKVRYTTRESYWVLKGEKDHQRSIMIKNYADLAKEIINSPYYFGETFSFGDKEIKERALGLNKKGPGGHKEWVAIAANHHLAVVIEQLSSVFGI